jgi:hypothetical protein
MARCDGTALAFVPPRGSRRNAFLLFPPNSRCTFSTQRPSLSEVSPRARGDRDRPGAVACLGIRKYTTTKGMASLLMDLSDPDDQCADLRLSRYRRRQISGDQDHTLITWPPPNSRITHVLVSDSRICQYRPLLAWPGGTCHAGGVDTRLRRFALVFAMADPPGALKPAGGHSVVSAGDRDMVEVVAFGDGGTAGRRDGGTAGRRVGGTAGRRDGGTAGRRGGGSAGRRVGGSAGRRVGGSAWRRVVFGVRRLPSRVLGFSASRLRLTRMFP